MSQRIVVGIDYGVTFSAIGSWSDCLDRYKEVATSSPRSMMGEGGFIATIRSDTTMTPIATTVDNSATSTGLDSPQTEASERSNRRRGRSISVEERQQRITMRKLGTCKNCQIKKVPVSLISVSFHGPWMMEWHC